MLKNIFSRTAAPISIPKMTISLERFEMKSPKLKRIDPLMA